MKVEFSAFPKAFSGNVAMFVAADKQLLATAQAVDAKAAGALTRALGAGRFTGAKNQTLTILGQSGEIARLMLLGVGKGRELDARTAEGLGGVVAAAANAAGHTAVTVVVDPVKGSRLSPGQIAAHLALGVRLRNYRFDKYKTKDKPEQKLSLEQLTVVVAGPAEARKAYAQLEPAVDAVFFTRDLVSEPANMLYPVEFGRRAKELTKLGVKVEVLGEAEMKKLGMNVLLAVGQGSERESQLLVMRWMNGPKDQAPVALIGKQKIQDAGTLYPKRMETVDDEIRDKAIAFLDKAKADNKPFFLWLNPTRMHVVTHLSPKYEALRNSKNGWSLQEAGMAQLDDDIGIVMKKLKDMGVDDNTIVVFTTDNGTETFTWPDGGNTPFKGQKGTIYEGGFRVPAMVRWPGKVPANKVENGIIALLDWFPTLVAAAGNPNIVAELKQGKSIGGTNYKVHLDGYNQMDMITGKGPSNRHEIFYFGESTLGAVRIDDYKYRFIEQPQGWIGPKVAVDAPAITNLRLDPFERLGQPESGSLNGAQGYFNQWFLYQFWRFVFVQEEVAKLAQTAIEFPPMQKGASFNLEAVKAKIEAARAAMGK